LNNQYIKLGHLAKGSIPAVEASLHYGTSLRSRAIDLLCISVAAWEARREIATAEIFFFLYALADCVLPEVR